MSVYECSDSCVDINSDDEGTSSDFSNMNLDPSETVFMCGYASCNCMYKTKHELEIHSLLHSKSPELVVKATENDAKEQSKASKCKKKRIISCPFEECGKKFSRPNKLSSHLSFYHHKEKQFPCTVEGCEKRYTLKQHLKRHLEIHKVKSAAQYICKENGCHLQFSHECLLANHMNTHRRYECPVDGCGQIFKKKDLLKSHGYSHSNIYPFKCNIVKNGKLCDKAYITRTRLKRHLKSHEGYKCSVEDCDVVCDTWTELRTHLSIQHKNSIAKQLKPSVLINCSYEGCPNTFKWKKNLVAHIKYVHEGLSFKCQLCSKVLSTKQKLKLHYQAEHYVKQITDEECMQIIKSKNCTKSSDNSKDITNSFKCRFQRDDTLCNKYFLSKNDLENHIKTHAGMYCTRNQCDVVCKTWQEFKKHRCSCPETIDEPTSFDDKEMIHTTTDFHQCPYEGCQKSYKQKRFLMSHIKSIHEKSSFKCQHCSHISPTERLLNHHYEAEHYGKQGSNFKLQKKNNCGGCSTCLRADCGECYFCLDMPKFGGPGTKKQKCLNRTCLKLNMASLITDFLCTTQTKILSEPETLRQHFPHTEDNYKTENNPQNVLVTLDSYPK